MFFGVSKPILEFIVLFFTDIFFRTLGPQSAFLISYREVLKSLPEQNIACSREYVCEVSVTSVSVLNASQKQAKHSPHSFGLFFCSVCTIFSRE